MKFKSQLVFISLSLFLTACGSGSAEPTIDEQINEVDTSDTGTNDTDTSNTDTSSVIVVCPDDAYTIIENASDDGTNDGHLPENTIDGDNNEASRWSSDGSGKTIHYDLGEVTSVKALSIHWYQGNTRSSYFEVDTSTDNISWTSVLTGGSSSGEDTAFEDIDVIDSEARYVRITGLGNSTNTWNSIIETQILRCNDIDTSDDYIADSGSDTGSESTLDDWDWSVWDLEGGDEELDPVVGETMVFNALTAQHVTPNGSGWRHELKIKSSERVAMTEVYEDFQANITLDLSDGSKTIVAQHHAGDTGTIMKLYVSDSSESGFNDSIANNGVFDVYVRLAKEDGSGEEKKALGTIVSGDNFDFQVINDHGYVTVSAMGESFSLTIEDSSSSYLKFGNYLQAQDAQTRIDVEDSADWADFYQQAGITISEVTFKNLSYIRNVD